MQHRDPKHHLTRFNQHRRELLLALGVGMLTGPAQVRSQSLSHKRSDMAAPACTVTPEQTEGPYFVDNRLHRSDIRSDASIGNSDKVIKTGVPLTLTLKVLAVRNDGCAPLAGAIVDIWHCDAAGVYSGVGDETSFLRGYQITDDNGSVQFQTIYPGWYPGRAVHVHFKVRARGQTGRQIEFTSQLYFADALTASVHAHAPYAARAGKATPNKRDGLFRHGGSDLMPLVTEAGNGYAASFDIGLRVA